MEQPLVTFFEDGHTYFHKIHPLKSVSSWVSMYSDKFNSDYWLEYKTLQKCFPLLFTEYQNKFYKGKSMPSSELFSKIKQNLNKNQIYFYEKEIIETKNSWRYNNIQSTSKGTQFHLVKEYKALNDGFEINPFSNKKIKTIDIRRKDVNYQNHSLAFNPYIELEDGYYPEFLAWNLSIQTAGQVDCLFIESIKDKRYVDIDDHKTNNKKQMKSSGMFPLKGALSHLKSNPVQKYTIQINFYAWMMAQMGFTPRNLSFTWYEDYDENKKKVYKVKYDPELIETIIRNAHSLN